MNATILPGSSMAKLHERLERGEKVKPSEVAAARAEDDLAVLAADAEARSAQRDADQQRAEAREVIVQRWAVAADAASQRMIEAKAAHERALAELRAAVVDYSDLEAVYVSELRRAGVDVRQIQAEGIFKLSGGRVLWSTHHLAREIVEVPKLTSWLDWHESNKGVRS
ncbi:MAG: hypothetical protein R2715_15090 [Ilumatobacteraceae bacterium]